jgi:hypothetical protein
VSGQQERLEAIAAANMEELRLLRVASATCLRYLTGEIASGLRDGRHPPEVAANIAAQQARNLREAIERTGELAPDGSATGQFLVPTPESMKQSPTSDQEEGDWPEVWLIRVNNLLSPSVILCLDSDQARGWEETGAEVRRYIPVPTSDLSVDVEEGAAVSDQICETCGSRGKRQIADDRYCDCIMTAHCHGSLGKDGKRCRLSRFGSGGEGSPGVAGAPMIAVPCEDCNGTGRAATPKPHQGGSDDHAG